MQISGVSLALTWPCRPCLLRVFLCPSRCYKLSPFQTHWGRWHCSQACVFIYSSCGKWVFPPSPLEFSSHHHFYKLSRSWLLGVCCCSCLLQLAYCEGFPLPLFSAQVTPPSLLHVFFGVIAYYSVFFSFFLGGDQSVQGTRLIWPRVVCGSSACHLGHLVVCVFPSSLGAGVWQHRSPPGFSI
jgi:hypothetical protein